MVVAFAVERDGEDGERAARGAPRSIVGAAFGCGGGPGLSSRRTVATRGAAACAQATRRQRARGRQRLEEQHERRIPIVVARPRRRL